MLQLVCSPRVREKLERELAAAGIAVTPDAAWALVERGHPIPHASPAVVFDPLDYMDAVRLVTTGLRPSANELRAVTGQRGSSYAVIAPRDVRYVEATGEGIVARTAAGEYRLRQTLQYYESVWAGIGFLRVNRSQLVNLAHVAEIVPWFNSRYVLRLKSGDELEVSKTYAKRLRSALRIQG